MKKLSLLFILFMMAKVMYGLNFSIAPTKFNINLNKIETQEAYIINNTAEPLRIEVYVDTAEGYEKNNLNSNIVVFPKIVSVKPGMKQVVRFRVKPSKDMKKGEYKSLLVFKEKPKDIKIVTDENSKNFETDFKFITEVAVGVKGTRD